MPNSTLPADVTALLRKVSGGDGPARDELLTVVYGELRRMARRSMRNERREHTLQPTALVHEVFLRLIGENNIDWQDRAHFFAIAAQTMRRVLVDYARTVHAKKRSGGQRVDIESLLGITEAKSTELVALDLALQRLEAVDPRQCRVVELRYFAGLSTEETAAALGLSARTVKREWQMAKAWLHSQIAD